MAPSCLSHNLKIYADGGCQINQALQILRLILLNMMFMYYDDHRQMIICICSSNYCMFA